MTLLLVAALRLRVNLRALLHELLRLFFDAALEGSFVGNFQFGSVFAAGFGDLHRAKWRASCCVGHHESGSALFSQRGVEALSREVIGVVDRKSTRLNSSHRCIS